MTKVCHLSSAHAPNDTRIFHKQCASLAKAGYQVSFVVKAKDAQSVGCTTQDTPLWTLNTKRNSPSLPLKSLFWKRLSRAMRSTKRTLTVLSL